MSAESLMRALAQGEAGSRRLRVVSVPTPAAGADWSTTVPGGEVWLVRGVIATLTTSAVVANRAPKLTFSDGSTTLFRVNPGAVLTATLVTVVNWILSYSAVVTALTGTDLNVSIPEFVAQSGFRIGSLTTALDVGDQWSAIALFVEVATKSTPEQLVIERARYFED